MLNNVPTMMGMCVRGGLFASAVRVRGRVRVSCRRSVEGCTRNLSRAGVMDICQGMPMRLTGRGGGFRLDGVSGGTEDQRCVKYVA